MAKAKRLSRPQKPAASSNGHNGSNGKELQRIIDFAEDLEKEYPTYRPRKLTQEEQTLIDGIRELLGADLSWTSEGIAYQYRPMRPAHGETFRTRQIQYDARHRASERVLLALREVLRCARQDHDGG